MDTYKAYPVGIWTTDGTQKIAQITPALNGTYRIELEPGQYQVVLEKTGNLIGGSNLPVTVVICSYEKTILDIDINTGIR